ncbi:NADH-quinone oxidoreductase subunit C [Streptomyces sp. NPDC005562]|uniref:NADH-quinone oxidoreductase subunit C n=1 Tax=Streptomyces sp. NPDC005562 TaxID=3154890 RepID=UPI00339E67DB
MTGWLPSPVEELFGAEATADESYDVLTVDVPPTAWLTALDTARTTLACTYFDWLSAVDEPGTGFRICAHVVALAPVRRLLLRTTVAHEAPVLASAVDVYAGAAWHERETHEMFGVTFEGHPGLTPLLLPESFEGHPLRKDFVLAARVAKAWPGAKEPGESEHGGPKRRQMLPPGVPDPNEWGPLKGQLPAAPARPARPARGAGRAAASASGPASASAPGERPPRRTRTAGQGSASQAAASPAAAGAAEVGQPEAPARPPRRSRSVSQGSASQRGASPEAGPGPGPGPVSEPKTPVAPEPTPEAEPKPMAPRSSDAPWHHARPAFDETTEAGEAGEATEATETTEATEKPTEPEPESAPQPATDPQPKPEHPGKPQATPTETPENGEGPQTTGTAQNPNPEDGERQGGTE